MQTSQQKKLATAKIIENLRIFKGFKRESELAEFLGVKPSTLSTWKTRGGVDKDLVFRKCKGISYDWLETGEGEMLEQDRPVGGEDENDEIARLQAELRKEKELLSTAEFYRVMAGLYGVIEDIRKERKGGK